MKRYILALLLTSAVYCCAMDGSDSEYFPDYKQERDSIEEPIQRKKLRMRDQVTFYAISPSDSERVFCNTKHKSLMNVLMWQYVSPRFRLSEQYLAMEEVLCSQNANAQAELLAQNGGVLRQFCMKCPVCEMSVQSVKGKKELFLCMYKHWFIYKMHQQKIYAELKRLVATSEDQARANFKHYGLPASRIVPFAQQNPTLWHIADTRVIPPVTYKGPSQKAVADQFFNMNVAQLSADSNQVRTYAQMLMQCDALVKVLGVQEGYSRKGLTCPERGCEHITFEDVKDGNDAAVHAALFTSVALHCLKTHKVRTNTYAQALDLVAPSYEQACDKSMLLYRDHESNNNFNAEQDEEE